MADTTGQMDPELVLRHTDWVLGLARSLAGGEADDLAQDTWTAALAGPAPRPGSVRGWLRAIARNVHARRASRAAARVDVEARGARSEARPATDVLVSRAELQRRVLHEVMGLAEPYRTTVLLRHFEGLSVEELSRRMEVPASTGRTRLRRALARLRERLDAEYGGRVAWALAPVLAGRHGFPGPGFTETLLMTTKTKLALAALVAVGGTAAVWTLAGARNEDEEGLATLPASVAGETEDVPAIAEGGEEDPAARRAVARSAEVPVAETEPVLAPVLEPPAPSEREVWLEVEDMAARLHDGSMQVRELVALSEELLRGAQPDDSRWSEEGRLTYELMEDEEFGKATLAVHPGHTDEPGEFEIRVDLETSPGFRHPEDAQGAVVFVRFGVAEEGLGSVEASTQSLTRPDPGVWKKHEGETVHVGGYLLVRDEESFWQQVTIRFEEGRGHYGTRDERSIHPGDLASPELQALGGKLRSLRLRNR